MNPMAKNVPFSTMNKNLQDLFFNAFEVFEVVLRPLNLNDCGMNKWHNIGSGIGPDIFSPDQLYLWSCGNKCDMHSCLLCLKEGLHFEQLILGCAFDPCEDLELASSQPFKSLGNKVKLLDTPANMSHMSPLLLQQNMFSLLQKCIISGALKKLLYGSDLMWQIFVWPNSWHLTELVTTKNTFQKVPMRFFHQH